MVTSWFWLVGIVVLSLLPPLIKDSIGGNEDTATAYLALFSVAVGVGSWLAAAIARGRIVLGTTVAGAVLLGIFSLDLGIGVWGVPPADASCTGRRRFSRPSPACAPPSISPASRSAAGCSSCRPSPRCRPGPAPTIARARSRRSTCSTPPS